MTTCMGIRGAPDRPDYQKLHEHHNSENAMPSMHSTDMETRNGTRLDP